MKPSIPVVRCMGPLPFCETHYIDSVRGKIPWGEISDSRKIDLLKRFSEYINIRERALWEAAERLSDFGEGQLEIYDELLELGRKK